MNPQKSASRHALSYLGSDGVLFFAMCCRRWHGHMRFHLPVLPGGGMCCGVPSPLFCGALIWSRLSHLIILPYPGRRYRFYSLTTG